MHELPVPQPNAREVLIRLGAAGVGTWDPSIRSGDFTEGDERFPLVLGTDGAGTIAAIGARVERFAVGDRVYAYAYGNSKGGCYAEYVAVAAGKVAPVPDQLDEIHAGAVPAIGFAFGFAFLRLSRAVLHRATRRVHLGQRSDDPDLVLVHSDLRRSREPFLGKPAGQPALYLFCRCHCLPPAVRDASDVISLTGEVK